MAKQLREIRVCGKVAYVPLTQGYEAVIDVDDVGLVSGFSWQVLVLKRQTYALRKHRIGLVYRNVYLHRALMDAPAGMQVDHMDTDGLNNRRGNLRLATRHQNGQNSRLSRRNTSGFKGVSWDRQRNKWRAKIKFGDKQSHLGLFDSAEGAHAAYCEASARLHGEFGRTE